MGLWDGPIGILGHTRGGMAEDPVFYLHPVICIWNSEPDGAFTQTSRRLFPLRRSVGHSLPPTADPEEKGVLRLRV